MTTTCYGFDKNDNLIATKEGKSRIVNSKSREYKEVIWTHDFCYYCGMDNGVGGEERWPNFSCAYCGCS